MLGSYMTAVRASFRSERLTFTPSRMVVWKPSIGVSSDSSWTILRRFFSTFESTVATIHPFPRPLADQEHGRTDSPADCRNRQETYSFRHGSVIVFIVKYAWEITADPHQEQVAGR